MSRLILPACLLLLAASPQGSNMPRNAVNPYQHPDERAIAIQNWSSSKVDKAEIQTTDGRVWRLAKGGIPRNEAHDVAVPVPGCIANVSVTMQSGRQFQLVGLHDCSDTQIVVRNTGLSIPQMAVPGAKQHGTPG